MFFFFKQKTAYEMRISDWSSDVCSSDLLCRDAGAREGAGAPPAGRHHRTRRFHAERAPPEGRPQDLVSPPVAGFALERFRILRIDDQIGRASCRERVCQYV